MSGLRPPSSHAFAGSRFAAATLTLENGPAGWTVAAPPFGQHDRGRLRTFVKRERLIGSRTGTAFADGGKDTTSHQLDARG